MYFTGTQGHDNYSVYGWNKKRQLEGCVNLPSPLVLTLIVSKGGSVG